MIQIRVSHVDGSASDWQADDSVYDRLLQPGREGYQGRQLVDRLLTDDSGPPPAHVRLVGTLGDGTTIDEHIACETRRRRP